MKLTIVQSIIFFGVISLVTMFIRVIPFVLFPENKKVPKYIAYLGEVLPYTIIGMLVVYCMKNVSFIRAPFGIAEILSIIVIGALHWWKKNTLLSIGAGTILYMILIKI